MQGAVSHVPGGSRPQGEDTGAARFVGRPRGSGYRERPIRSFATLPPGPTAQTASGPAAATAL